MLTRSPLTSAVRGTSLIEVLVAVVILAFGLLGLAAFQMRSQAFELESFQRAQALILLEDISARIQANSANAASYVSSSLGTGAAACTVSGNGSAADDQCEWSNLLQGSAELSGSSKIGAMVGARGCITQIQAPNTTAGVCAPGIYRISVAWQGLSATAAPADTCGTGNYGGNDALRRVVSTQIAVALLGCT